MEPTAVAAEACQTPQAIASSPPEEAAPAGTVRSLIETTKPGITKLVTITSGVGFVMASATHSWSLRTLVIQGLACITGTALSAAGANAINQYLERERDGRMRRTERRPLPQGRVQPATVLTLGVGCGLLGCLLLWAVCGATASLISLACIVSYVAVYTPLKTRTALATFVGAIPGALPPLIGWVTGAEHGGLASLRDAGGLSLFILMFVWQIPHFLAIAWMYRDDYAKGGYLVLPVIDPAGGWTAITIGLWSVALVPATLLPAIVMPDQLGFTYFVFASLASGLFLLLGAKLIVCRGRKEARQLFFASIIHLPIVLVVMVGESLTRSLLV